MCVCTACTQHTPRATHAQTPTHNIQYTQEAATDSLQHEHNIFVNHNLFSCFLPPRLQDNPTWLTQQQFSWQFSCSPEQSHLHNNNQTACLHTPAHSHSSSLHTHARQNRLAKKDATTALHSHLQPPPHPSARKTSNPCIAQDPTLVSSPLCSHSKQHHMMAQLCPPTTSALASAPSCCCSFCSRATVLVSASSSRRIQCSVLLGSSRSSRRDAHQLTASGLLAAGLSPNLLWW